MTWILIFPGKYFNILTINYAFVSSCAKKRNRERILRLMVFSLFSTHAISPPSATCAPSLSTALRVSRFYAPSQSHGSFTTPLWSDLYAAMQFCGFYVALHKLKPSTRLRSLLQRPFSYPSLWPAALSAARSSLHRNSDSSAARAASALISHHLFLWHAAYASICTSASVRRRRCVSSAQLFPKLFF